MREHSSTDFSLCSSLQSVPFPLFSLCSSLLEGLPSGQALPLPHDLHRAGKAKGDGLMRFLRNAPRVAPEPEDQFR